MSYAYTPGLKVKKATIVTKSRILPIPGEVLVKEVDHVSYNTVVARTSLQGDVTMVNVVAKLGIDAENLSDCLLKKVGDKVEKGETLAESRSFFGLFKSIMTSDASGSVEHISEVTGMVAIRQEPDPFDVEAYVSGNIKKVIPERGVVIETYASFVQGIFGIGGERQGELKIIAGPDEVLTADIPSDCAGKILVGGALVTKEYIKKALEVKAKGIVVGGINSRDIMDLLGYEIGVAITGNEAIGLTLIVTEGFGRMNMSSYTYNLLKSLEGRLASVNGKTQIRAGVLRPEIIVPLEEVDLSTSAMAADIPVEGMKINTLVRIIRKPYFGAIGRVTSLPAELQTIDTGSSVRVLEVELNQGKKVMVPRANVELMED